MDLFLPDNSPNLFPEVYEDIFCDNFPDFVLPEFQESQDFTEKVRKLIHELDSFEVKISTSASYKTDNQYKYDTSTIQIDNPCINLKNDALDISSCNLSQQQDSQPVLEAHNLESLLEKFEATEGANSKEYSSGNLEKNVLSTVQNNNFQELNTIHSTDHDYCSSFPEQKPMYNRYRETPLCSPKSNSTMQFEARKKKQKKETATFEAIKKKKLINSKRNVSPYDYQKSKYVAENPRYIERQKIIYVGKIPNTINSELLESAFSKYGDVMHTSLFFRKDGDNYGFVTFYSSEDAANVLSSYKNDQDLVDFDLCYGARRSFCKRVYSDLDSKRPDVSDESSCTSDFDKLLREAKAKMAHKK